VNNNKKSAFTTSLSDKQQELDIPSLHTDDNQQDEARQNKASSSSGASTSSQSGSQSKKKVTKVTPMSHISGVKRALSHTNSFAGERLPKFGVDTPKEEELGHVSQKYDKLYITMIILLFYNNYNIVSLYKIRLNVYDCLCSMTGTQAPQGSSRRW